MKKLRDFADAPISSPVVAEEIRELHAARLLLLFRHCGVKTRRIDGLTKMAKLDFFVRYPSFFSVASAPSSRKIAPPVAEESRMVRYHYGPWDERYYELLGYLEALGLLTVRRKGTSFEMELTDQGVAAADELTVDPSFDSLVAHMKQVKKSFGRKSGTALKNLIYDLFQSQVGDRSLGEVIE